MKQVILGSSWSSRRARWGGWTLAAALLLASAPDAHAEAMTDLQIELLELVEQEDETSVAQLRARVEEGLPPAALSAMLDACREHPRTDLEPLLRDLAMHRTAAIRARALLAWAGLGPTQSVAAIEAAADDGDAGVRRLAVVLGRLHPSDRADAVVRSLLEQDEDLAAELAAQELEAPEDDADDADEDRGASS